MLCSAWSRVVAETVRREVKLQHDSEVRDHRQRMRARAEAILLRMFGNSLKALVHSALLGWRGVRDMSRKDRVEERMIQILRRKDAFSLIAVRTIARRQSLARVQLLFHNWRCNVSSGR